MRFKQNSFTSISRARFVIKIANLVKNTVVVFCALPNSEENGARKTSKFVLFSVLRRWCCVRMFCLHGVYKLRSCCGRASASSVVFVCIKIEIGLFVT